MAMRVCADGRLVRPGPSTDFQGESIINAEFWFILLSTFLVGLSSIVLAAFFSLRLLARHVDRMVSFSIGILLGTAFLHLLPEAFESTQGFAHGHEHGEGHVGSVDPHALFIAMFAGILILFFLEKFALYRHSHHFEGDGHSHEHGHDAREAGHGGALVLIGSAFHNFVDGILIAGAFLAGPWIGFAAALSIFAHEVPHKISDFIVLLHAGLRKPRAVAYALSASLCIVAGGLIGYFMLARIAAWIPFVLALAAANFLYISLSDLVPRAQRGLAWTETLSQVVLLACGILIVVVLRGGAHLH